MASDGKKSLQILGFGIAEILGILAVIAIFFGVLNYFNILSLSSLYPKYFGSLPHQPLSQSTQTISTNFTLQKTSYSCPLDAKYCKNGEVVVVPDVIPPFYGIGYANAASETAVLAVVPGQYSSGVSVGKNGKKSTVLAIINEEMGVEVDYSLEGTAYIPKAPGRNIVNQGDTIGFLNGEYLDKGLFDKPYNLVVSIQDLKTKQFIKLKVSANGKTLEK